MRWLLLDAMLGRLAASLRMCGHDTAYTLDEGVESDDEILEDARETGRTLLTRDRQLAARADAGILLESREIKGQLAELHDAGLALEPSSEPAFCGACNGSLSRVDPARTTPDYAPLRTSGAAGTAASTSGKAATGATSSGHSRRFVTGNLGFCRSALRDTRLKPEDVDRSRQREPAFTTEAPSTVQP